ncbi:MAG: phage head closure protein [Pseudomonadota bacterium]
MKPTSPDELNKRVTIQAQTKTADGLGGFVTSWTDIATVWAAVWPTSANEITAANATSMVVSHRIRIRWRSVMRAAWRIKFENRYFSIVGITSPNEAREWLDILTKEAAS